MYLCTYVLCPTHVQVSAAEGETWAQISWGQLDGISCGAEHSAPAALPTEGTAGVCWYVGWLIALSMYVCVGMCVGVWVYGVWVVGVGVGEFVVFLIK